MSISMRELFSRQGIAGEVISLRHSLANHPEGLKMGLREAHKRLLALADGNGFARGCRRPGSVVITVADQDVGLMLPAWVPIAGTTSVVRDHTTGETRFAADFSGETRTIEGILVKSKITDNDFPFQPWHTYYDWNFYVRADTQYTYLNSPTNIEEDEGLIECEWDTAFLPSWAWPQDGDRIWLVGRWIYDCGHPTVHGHKSEIHPPKAIASFRSEAVQFEGNPGPTRANTTALFIGREGGYWRQPINDQDYAFDLYLPPQPYAEAVPRWTIAPQTGVLPVQPQLTPFPAGAPRALRVVIPLKGVNPHPENYGVIISGGWSDPLGTEATLVKRFRVTIEEILMDANLDPTGADEWYIYVGVNGHWNIWQSLSGASHRLNYSVDLALHPSDQIHITVCGFEADEIHDLIGDTIGLSWAEVCDPGQAVEKAEKIRNGFLRLGTSLDPWILNEAVGSFSQFHPPEGLETVTVASPTNDYRLRYRIEESRAKSLRRFLLLHGFNPANGVRQVGSGSLKSLMA